MYLFKRAIDGQVSDLQRMLGLQEFKVNDKDELKLTPLHYAAWYNKADVVDTLLKHGADVNAKDANEATPLHYASRYKQRMFTTATGDVVKSASSVGVIRQLLEAGAHINSQDCYGDTPLFLAVLRGNVEAVRELLAIPAIDLQLSDSRGFTTLHLASKFNRADIANMLLTEGVGVRCGNDRKMTAMHYASIEGNLEIISMLLKASPEEEKEVVNDVNVDDESPLDLAIENRKLQTCHFLISKGAKVRKTCREICSSPLHIAASSGDVEICKMLLDQDKHLVQMRNMSHALPLHLAAQYDRGQAAELLIQRGTNIESPDEDKLTPLLTAAEHGSNVTLRLLLNSNANLSALSKSDQSAIHLAAKTNKTETMKILLEHIQTKGMMERMISSDDKIGNSPLHLAAESGFTKIVKMLLKYGADIENKNEDEETALHVAAKCGMNRVVDELLKDTEDPTIINDTEEDANTPLHLAAANGHTKAVESLLKAGADIGHKNRLSQTPLACAAEGGWAEAVKILLKAGSEPSAKNRNRKTPLHLAAMNGHDGVVKILLKHNATVSKVDSDTRNVLDTAIHYGQTNVAMALIESDQWQDALKNKTEGKKDGYCDTPLRNLIRKMPVVTEKVFDRCISYPRGMDVKNPELEMHFNFQFLDDTYSCCDGWSDIKSLFSKKSGKLYDTHGLLAPDATPYTSSPVIREDNHPLTIMVKSGRTDLLHHPLVLALIRHKWRLAQISYFSFLLYYILFVALFTTYMVLTLPPFMYNTSYIAHMNSSLCHMVDYAAITQADRVIVPSDGWIFAILIFILAGFGILVEILQIYSTPASYLFNLTNLLDWFTYISACVVLAPIAPCNIKTHWQWQLGSMCMFVAWVDLILFLRRLPGVGIYIVMVGEVFGTFIKFFVFCFSLFIFAFGFTFYVLLRNQDPFATPGYAFIKTGVMMIGEMDFGDMFHGDDEYDTSVYYETLTYALFILFLCLVTIVIMNLLTGLAVGDVQEIQEAAKLKKLAMQIELSLDVETSLPESLRKKFNCVIGWSKIRPNKARRSHFMYGIKRFLNGPLASASIAKAVYLNAKSHNRFLRNKQDRFEHVEDDTTVHSGLDEGGDGNTATLSVHTMQQKVLSQMAQTRGQMKQMADKLERLELMFSVFLEKSNIELGDALIREDT